MVYVTMSCNLITSTDSPILSKREVFTGCAATFHDYHRAEFGQLVTTHRVVRVHDVDPRADVGVILNRDMKSLGGACILDLETGEIRTRHDYRPIAWSAADIRRLYELTEPGIVGTHAEEETTFGIAVGDTDYPIQDDDPKLRYGTGTESNHGTVPVPDYAEAASSSNELPASGGDNSTNRRSTRVRKPPDRYDVNFAYGTQVRCYDTLEEAFRVLNLSIAKATREYGSDSTMNAVLGEIKQLVEQKVWEYLPANEYGGNVLPSSLFLKAKFDSDGTFEKLKARLVAHGNHQILDDIFGSQGSSPTINIAIVNLLVAMAAKKGLAMRAIDIKGAYLNADLPTAEVMRINRDVANIMVKSDPTLGQFVRRDGSIHVELQKALYGLKTAGKEWYRLLCSKLESWGYTKIAVYVDDLLVIDDDTRKIDELQDQLRREFKEITVKTGPKISFLGMTIEKQECGDYVISQQAYAEEISQAYASSDIKAKAPKSPANSNFKKSNPNSDRFDSATYRSEVMKFLYLATRTRPDILYATAVLASRANDPSVDDFHKLTRLAQYVHKTAKDSICFSKKGKFVISGFADASFASHTDAKGHTGYAIFIDGTSAAIACKSIKQRSVAHSSMEAELIAMHDMLRHILWIRDVVDELDLRDDKSKPVSIQQDNMPAISAVTSDLGSMLGRSKYIDRRLFTVHEYIENGQVKIEYCATEDMVADLLTKSLTGNKANRFKVTLMGNANDH